MYYVPIYSPAAGRITSIDTIENSNHSKIIKISIFLDMFDDHTQYTPTFGKILKQDHIPGRKLPAFLDVGSVNEQLMTHMYNPLVGNIYIKQIAGTLYRRIRSYLTPRQHVVHRQPMGKILFGSRVDLYIPQSNFIKSDILQKGNLIYGGISVLGYYSV